MSIKKVREYFKGSDIKILESDESSATVELAAAAFGIEADQIAKSLAFLVDDSPVLILMSGCSRVDNHKFKDFFHQKASMIPFEKVEGYIGHAPGGVCPFAINEGVKVYLDNSLKKYDVVYPAAGSENSAVKLTISELERYSKFESWADIAK